MYGQVPLCALNDFALLLKLSNKQFGILLKIFYYIDKEFILKIPLGFKIIS